MIIRVGNVEPNDVGYGLVHAQSLLKAKATHISIIMKFASSDYSAF